MTTKSLLSLTLLATALTLNAALPKDYTRTSIQKANSISARIANILYNRGIDKDKAIEISQNFIHGREELFTLTLYTFVNNSSFTQEEVLERLSMMALQKRNVDFSSYASLVRLAQELKIDSFDKALLSNLEEISSKNSVLKKVFA